MKNMLIALLLGSVLNATAQTVDAESANNTPLSSRAFVTAGGTAFSNTKYVKFVGGTPYFSDDWMIASISAPDGKTYKGVRAKLDLMDNSLLYMDDNGQLLETYLPMKQIALRDSLKGTNKTHLFNNVALIPGAPSNAKGFYEQLAGGKAMLYKEYAKKIAETKTFGSSITEQTIRTETRFYLGYNGQLIKIKKASEIAEATGNAAFTEYVKTNKLGKSEEDLLKAVEYFNSMK